MEGAINLPVEPAAVEAAGEAAVEIAAIEAERDIAVAEIHAEVASEAIEAQEQDDVAWLGGRLQELQDNCETNAEGLSRQQIDLTLLQSGMSNLTEAMTAIQDRLATMEALILLQSQQAPLPTLETSESGGGHSEAETPEEVAEMPVPAEPPPQKVRRWL